MAGSARQDLSHLVGAGLLVAAACAFVTGYVADSLDLNRFLYHKYAGYAVALLALVHVGLIGRRALAYARVRLGRGPAPGAAGARALAALPGPAPTPAPGPEASARPCGGRLPRRALLGPILGGVGGFALGRLAGLPGDGDGAGDPGAAFHESSKLGVMKVVGTLQNWGGPPPLYKEYPGAERVVLPPPGPGAGLPTEEAIRRRRSVRDFATQPMTRAEVSRLLYHAVGITAERHGNRLRAAPSAGALYPIEAYLVVHRVADLAPGLYHYDVRGHALALLRAADLRADVARAGLAQEFLGQAHVVLVLTAILQRLRWKYQERAYRYALLEAGHIGQNVYLEAAAHGLGVCAVGAFLDDHLHALLGVDGKEEAAVYLLAAGKV